MASHTNADLERGGNDARVSNHPAPPASTTNADLERGNDARVSNHLAPPEEIITLFAVRLAILEKTASGLATLAFIWATVVVLGGFATSIETIDFWFATIISLIEGTRILRRSRELEWQHKTTSNKSEVSLVPCIWGLFKAKNVSRWFLRLQWLSGLVCAVLSLFRLCKQRYGVVLDSSTKNRKSALNIFYGLSLADAFLYLLQKACWKFLKPFLFSKVRSEYHFADSRDNRESDFEIYSLFSDTYSRCIKGSVLDGLGMGFVQHIADLLLSSDDNEQLRGAQIMSTITTKVEAQIMSTIPIKVQENRKQTLSAIEAKQEVVDRLIQMLNCRDQKEIRETAAGIVLDMVKITQNNNPVTSNRSFTESVGSLLYDSDTIEKDSSRYKVTDYDDFSVLGLRILRAVEDPRIIERIIKDLLPKIIGIIKLNPIVPSMPTKRVPHALELLKKLREKYESLTMKGMKINPECICNLSGILQHREIFEHGHLILSIDMLKALAKTKDGITISEAVLGNLFSVFLLTETHDNEEKERLVTGVGEALVLLSGNNKYNCKLMMKPNLGHDQLTLMARLSSKLDDPLRGIAVARILRNLCLHADEAELPRLSEIEAGKVLVLVMEKRDEHQEAAIGLAAQLLSLKKLEFPLALQELTSGSVTIASLISEILGAVRRNRCPPITKLSIEFLIEISKNDGHEIKHEIMSSMSEEVRDVLKKELKKRVRAPAT